MLNDKDVTSKYTKLYKDAMSNCVVNNGKILFTVNLNEEQIMEIYKVFSRDLLSCSIPHYRVIGFSFAWNRTKHSVVGMSDYYDDSLINIAKNMKYVIPAQLGGNEPSSIVDGKLIEKPCFFSEGECKDYSHSPTFIKEYGLNTEYANMQLGVLKCMHDEVGVVYAGGNMPVDWNSMPYKGRPKEQCLEINTSRLGYNNLSDDDYINAKMLVRNKKICNIHNGTAGKRRRVLMMYKRGTGRLKFEDTRALFVDNYDVFMPCPTQYDLSEFFYVRIPENGDNFLTLTPMYDIDYGVLTRILNEYGEELVV